MRIGIYTLPLNYNYGGLLQAYALQTTLQRMGHEVTIIDRPLHVKEAWWKRPREKAKRLVAKYILGRSNVRVFQENYEAQVYPLISRHTDTFIQRYLHRLQVSSPTELEASRFDGLVVGSDQIWRSAFHDSKTKRYDSFLAFAEKWRVKRISYAASFGTIEWEYNPEQTQQCRQLIELFDAVSVREASGVKLCQDHFGVKAKHVLDPTMLLEAADYEALVKQTNVPQSPGSLLVYILDQTSVKTHAVNLLATSLHLSPFSVNSRADDSFAPVEERIQPSVEQWLRGFMDAEYVITDSFHACVFSILFGKPFIVLGNKNRGMERFVSLLDKFQLQDRLILGEFDGTLPKSDIRAAQQLVKELREESKAFLLQHLK